MWVLNELNGGTVTTGYAEGTEFSESTEGPKCS